MSAILFGSISTLIDTSELQRSAFNTAFERHGLDWHWSRSDYRAMLRGNGGAERIAEHAREVGVTVDADAVHRTKSEVFQASLATAGLTARPGVAQTVADARAEGVRIGLVTTTSSDNVGAVLAALAPEIGRDVFDVVVDRSDVEQPKPDPTAYRVALDRLGADATACVAVEDNVGGTRAAVSAGVACVAFPNENTADHDFPVDRIERVELDDLRRRAGS